MVQPLDPAVDEDIGGEAQDHLGGALEVGDRSPLRGPVDCGHVLFAGVEGDLVDPGVIFCQSVPLQTGLGRNHQQSAFGGVAQDLPPLAVPVLRGLEDGVVAEGRDLEESREVRVPGGVDPGAVHLKLPLGAEAGAGYVHHPLSQEDLLDGHLVGGEGPGLVGADGGDGAEGLDGVELPDDGVPLRHPADAHRQGDGYHCRETFGDRRDRHRQGEEGKLDEFKAPQEPRRQGYAAGDEGEDHQLLAQVQGPAFEGRGGLPGFCDHPGDLSHLGGHPRREDEGLSPPLGDDRPCEEDVIPVADGKVPGQGVGLLPRGDRLAGEHRLVRLQVCGLDDPAVGGNSGPRLQEDDVAGDELHRLDPPLLPPAGLGGVPQGPSLG